MVKKRAALRPLEEAKNEIEQALTMYTEKLKLCEENKDKR